MENEETEDYFKKGIEGKSKEKVRQYRKMSLNDVRYITKNLYPHHLIITFPLSFFYSHGGIPEN